MPGFSNMATSRQRHISLVKANQEITDKVNRSLPIRITMEDVQNNVQFIKLLTTLTQHINEDGMCQAVSSDLKEAEEHIKHEKMRWLQQMTLHTELKELLLDQQIKFSESNTQLSSHQFYEAAAEALSIAEIEDYLDCHPEPGTGATLLGLKKEDICRRNPHQKYMHSLQQKLIPELEARLRKKCECVVSFHDSSAVATENSSLMFAKASQLPALLDSEKQKLEEERKQLIKDKSARERQFRQNYQTLMDTLTVLERLITEHRLQSKTEIDTVTSEWLTARCDAMCLKIRLLEMQLTCETYYEDTVQALLSIKKELDVTIDKTQSELSQVEQSLKAYTAVGDSFDNIVREYTYLKDEIESKKWALREFKHSLNSSLLVS